MSLETNFDPPYICKMPSGFKKIDHYVSMVPKEGFDRIAVPINPSGLPYNKFFPAEETEKESDITNADIMLTPKNWLLNAIVLLSDTYDCDSSDPVVRKLSEQFFLMELSHAESLMNIHKIMIKLKSGNNTNLARLCASKRTDLLVQVPAYNAIKFQSNLKEKMPSQTELEENDGWTWWNNFRQIYTNINLKVVIELSANEVPDEHDVVYRWLSEPLEAVIVPSSIFKRINNMIIPNEEWHNVLGIFMQCYTNIIISGQIESRHWPDYVDYFRELHFEYINTIPLGDDPALREQYLNSCYPIMPRLTSLEYEFCEKDETKYKAYRIAVMEAIKGLSPINKKLPVITVVNAGRGALVQTVIEAAILMECKIIVYAIENNPFAAFALRKLVQPNLKKVDNMVVVQRDPRNFVASVKADILVWEMYGLNGDTELAPELINSCIHNLMKPNGVCIPQKIITKISPVMSAILHKVNRLESHHGECYLTRYTKYYKHPEAHFQTVLGSACYLEMDAVLNEFSFPDQTVHQQFTYHKIFKFSSRLHGQLNGFSAHTSLVLSGTIVLTHARFMPEPRADSWYTMYFPLTTPIDVEKGENIEAHFWRCSDQFKIWYEWCCAKPRKTRIHNRSGRCQPLYLRQE